MAGNQPEDPAKAAGYPVPPWFYKLYTEDGPAPPPPAPVTGSFKLFEREFSLYEDFIATKPNNMIRQSADGSIDYRSELQSLLPEILPLYLELTKALINTPGGHTEMLSNLKAALAAAQHLTNMARVPQALATLQYILEMEIQDKQDALSKLKEQTAAIDAILQEAAQQLEEIERQPPQPGFEGNQPAAVDGMLLG